MFPPSTRVLYSSSLFRVHSSLSPGPSLRRYRLNSLPLICVNMSSLWISVESSSVRYFQFLFLPPAPNLELFYCRCPHVFSARLLEGIAGSPSHCPSLVDICLILFDPLFPVSSNWVLVMTMRVPLHMKPGTDGLPAFRFAQDQQVPITNTPPWDENPAHSLVPFFPE